MNEHFTTFQGHLYLQKALIKEHQNALLQKLAKHVKEAPKPDDYLALKEQSSSLQEQA